MINSVYINGLGAISPQETFSADSFLKNIIDYNQKYLEIIPPVYKEYIDPKALRRMSKIVRMGVASGFMSLKQANIEIPDAINTGTGLGCQADTEKFLQTMIDNDETLLNPSSFIQSTHNTIGGQIALAIGCNNYNMAYVHRTFSFETALLDSMMMITEGTAKNVLVGGVDEITEESYYIRAKIGHLKNEAEQSSNILNSKTIGALCGEGAAFAVVSDSKTETSYCKIDGVSMFYKPVDTLEIAAKITSFLQEHNLTPQDIDFVISGFNGDIEYDGIYRMINEKIFEHSGLGMYKNLCGEYDTSSAFATWMAANILKFKEIPSEIIIKKPLNKVKRVLIYNQFHNVNHSIILMSEC